MKAVILAAGMGTRLRPHTETTPKCLTDIHGQPILNYQLQALKKCGITDIAIVVGYLGDKIREHVANHEHPITIIENKDYAETNNAYSLTLARPFVESDPEGYLILNSDLIFKPQMLRDLIEAKEQDGIVIDQNPDLESDMVKIDMRNGQIYHMSKDLPAEKMVAEAVGPVKFSQECGTAYLNSIEGERNNWLFYTISDFAKKNKFYGIMNKGHVWAEVDTMEDLVDALKKIPENFIHDEEKTDQ